MARAIVELLIALARLALNIAQRIDRRAVEKEAAEAAAEHEKIDQDPAGWLIDHFGGGLRDNEGAKGAGDHSAPKAGAND